jgi:hypothetical protein
MDWENFLPIEVITLANPGFDPFHTHPLNLFIRKQAMILTSILYLLPRYDGQPNFCTRTGLNTVCTARRNTQR